MILLTWRDFTDGLASNLLAEMVGLVASIAVAYLVVDRLVRRHNRPLLRRFRAQIDSAASMMAFSWAATLGHARPDDALDAARGSMIDPMRERVATDDAPSVLLDAIRANPGGGPLELGRLLMEHAERVLTLGDHLSNVTSTDIQLETRLADLNSAVEDLAVVVRHWRDGGADANAREQQLIELCQAVFSRALDLKSYADEKL